MRTPSRNIRLSDEHWKAFKELLGVDWLKKQIDRAVAKENRKPTTHALDK